MKVSLVIPVKNEADSIERLITSAAAQTRRPDEIIIVDGGSNDGTTEIVERWAKRHSLSDWIRVVREEDATPGKGRNIGVINAKHEWIAFTDAGIRVEHFWLDRMVEVVEREEDVDVVYGGYEPIIETFFDRCAALAYVTPKRLRAGQWMRGPIVPSSLMRREVWEAVGGFQDLRAAEDLLFIEGIERKGFNIGWAPRALVWWRMQPTLSSTFHRFTLYSMHNVKIGRQSDWHYGIARQYAVGLLFAILAMTVSAWFWLVPVLGGCARAARSIWKRNEGQGMLWLVNPVQFLGVLAILVTIDVATFAGWGQALSEKRPVFVSHLLNLSTHQHTKDESK